jgi:hypothetical protein
MLLCAATLRVFGEGTNAPPGNSYDAFKIIPERNIFNPNRTARGGRPPREEAGRQPKVDVFGLVGTMIYEKGKFAFFDGSGSDYKKVLSPSDRIAGYTVTEVQPGRVKLENNGATVELTVGQQMKRQDEGEWKVSAARESIPSGSGGEKASDSSSSDHSTGSSGSAGEDEVLKRLLQKREEELKK